MEVKFSLKKIILSKIHKIKTKKLNSTEIPIEKIPAKISLTSLLSNENVLKKPRKKFFFSFCKYETSPFYCKFKLKKT